MLESNTISVVQEALSCQRCAAQLPHAPKPIIQIGAGARILIIGQAPGARAHASGIPWDDASGDLLRAWLDVDCETFYDSDTFAILPMGFCYPGRGKSGDLPPIPECANHWHDRIRAELKQVCLTLLIGGYAQKQYMDTSYNTLTEAVQQWHQFMPKYFPLPHPSPRNRPWQAKNPWFVKEVIPELRLAVKHALSVNRNK